ncbi:MAG: triose-phosphate isomerase [Casimicrobiaceae bacterium]|nr:triose-phosphate isomerase [Casimicrobiaceae bacterium]
MTAKRSRWVIGNWKMNGSMAGNDALVRAVVAGVESACAQLRVALCPAYVHLAQVSALLGSSRVLLGAQDVSAHPNGAYTGQVSAAMLVELGVSVVIVGHSERRTLLGESDVTVSAKAQAAIEAGLHAVVCVGETLLERDQGQAEAVVARQIDAVAPVLAKRPERALIAYEPVWAIGTGRTATVETAQAMHRFIRARLRAFAPALREMPILYGGSVKANNVRALAEAEDIDGALVGGASLDAREFVSIVQGVCDVQSATSLPSPI